MVTKRNQVMFFASPINPKQNTEKNRYPYLFANLSYLRKKYFEEMPLKILSFGCSTGEELLTLTKFFPADIIYGAEIDEMALSAAREKTKEIKNISIIDTKTSTLGEYGPFDLIICNSVLCVTTNDSRRLQELLPFERFEALLNELIKLLSQRAILSIINSSYLPSSSRKFYESLIPIRSHFAFGSYIPVFDSDYNLIMSRKKHKSFAAYVLEEKHSAINKKELFDAIWTNNKYISTERLSFDNMINRFNAFDYHYPFQGTPNFEKSAENIILPIKWDWYFSNTCYDNENKYKNWQRFFKQSFDKNFTHFLDEIGTNMLPRFLFEFQKSGEIIDLSNYN